MDGFWSKLSNLKLPQECKLSEWYVQRRGDRATFLGTGGLDMNIIASFGCEAVAIVTDRWRKGAKYKVTLHYTNQGGNYSEIER